MRILFTGASSFTGRAFVHQLVSEGHDVTATFTKNGLHEYTGLRQTRVNFTLNESTAIFGLRFGDAKFIKLLKKNNFDLFCHHGADVTNYKSESFNFSKALSTNTKNVVEILKILKSTCTKLILTGSIFEGHEGIGDNCDNAFSAYGLSKQFTFQVFKHFCMNYDIPVAKFVIPNPFGPFEEFRFTSFLVKSWNKGETPVIKTPDYIRDNIHISLLSEAYVKFCNEFASGSSLISKLNPSGYIESQANFTQRFSKQISSRLRMECPFELSVQTEFIEPIIRINYEPALQYISKWNEVEAWDELADYYEKYLLKFDK